MKHIFIFVALFLIITLTVTGIDTLDVADSVQQSAPSRVLLATSTSDYPVTPGDSYVLSYIVAREVATVTYIVDSNYQLNMGVFGIISSKGSTFTELKKRVEQIVSTSYPGSYPKLILNTPGSFTVNLNGEVPRSALIDAWGGSRG